MEAQNARHRAILASRVKLGLHLDAAVWTIAFSPDGKRLASGSKDRTARIWDATSGAQVSTLHHENEAWIVAVAYSLDGKTIATEDLSSICKIWDASTVKGWVVLRSVQMQND